MYSLCSSYDHSYLLANPFIKVLSNVDVFLKKIEGAPALIHQSEVSWDTALDPNDPTSSFKIGQVCKDYFVIYLIALAQSA